MPDLASQNRTPAATSAPAHEVVDDKVANADAQHAAGDAAASRMANAGYLQLAQMADNSDVGGFTNRARAMSADERGHVKNEFIRRHKFDSLPMAMQVALQPESPYHQEATIDGAGGINCTTAVRVEGVRPEQALAALTKTNWKQWWATSSTSGPPPSFDFVPEAPLAAIPGFHLHVNMSEARQEGKNWRLPAKLLGTFTGDAEMYIEAVDGGVVIHDTWMGMQLKNWAMQHLGGAQFWTKGHLEALRGAMAGGMLGATGFAGLRKFLLGHKSE